MATLFYCVFDGASQVANADPLQEGTVNIAATSTQSAAINGTNKLRRVVRLFSDADCFVTWGENPTALNDGTAGRPLGAENPEYFNIEAEHLIAVIERV